MRFGEISVVVCGGLDKMETEHVGNLRNLNAGGNHISPPKSTD